jgi:hypothetical protein
MKQLIEQIEFTDTAMVPEDFQCRPTHLAAENKLIELSEPVLFGDGKIRMQILITKRGQFYIEKCWKEEGYGPDGKILF